ncbi:hypothetical protein BDW75DRAFT_238093 [Aspergillus navahoensis]
MDLQSLAPLFYYTIASMLTITGLKRRRQTRLLLLGPVWLFSLMSLASSHRLRLSAAGSMVGADSTFASLMVFDLLYSAKALVFDLHAVSPERSPHGHDWSFVDCYRTWNNPRQLPLQLSRLEGDAATHDDRASKSRRLLFFSLTKATKAAALWAFEHFVFRKFFIHALGQVIVADFSPAMEAISLLQLQQLSVHLLQFYHSLLAVVFVAILCFDDPEEWPPLFGNPLEAYSVRRFWGRFWHRLTVPTYVFYARLVSRRLMRVRPGWALKKTVTALLVFTISGLSHSLDGWALGVTALFRDLLFFELCFLAAAVKTAASKMKTKRVAGMAWVFVFFSCVSPSRIYPKIYHTLLNPVR